MGPRELRAGMRGPTRALGFQAGGPSFHLPLAGALRFTVSLRTTGTGDGGRAALIGLALYRLDDQQERCPDDGHDAEREHDAGSGQLDLQPPDDLGLLLDRPHSHQWPLRGPQESSAAAVSL